MQPLHSNEVRLRHLRTGVSVRSILFLCAFIVNLPPFGPHSFPAHPPRCRFACLLRWLAGVKCCCVVSRPTARVSSKYNVRPSQCQSKVSNSAFILSLTSETFWDVKLTHKTISHLYFVTFNVFLCYYLCAQFLGNSSTFLNSNEEANLYSVG